MAVNMSASKEPVTKQRVPVMLITSWRPMERLAEVLDNFIFYRIIVYEIIGNNVLWLGVQDEGSLRPDPEQILRFPPDFEFSNVRFTQ